MPILKNQKIGKHEGCTQVNFGYGDISIATGEKQGDSSMKTLTLSQHFPKPEEEYEDLTFKAGTLTDDIPGPIVEFTFKKKKSVEMLIDQLKYILEDFN